MSSCILYVTLQRKSILVKKDVTRLPFFLSSISVLENLNGQRYNQAVCGLLHILLVIMVMYVVIILTSPSCL